jgi:hypothetical protein
VTRRTKAQLEAELNEIRGRHSISEAVWATLEATPGFNKALERGEQQIADGNGTPWREMRREPDPPPSSWKVALTVLMIVADIAVILVAITFLLRMWLG